MLTPVHSVSEYPLASNSQIYLPLPPSVEIKGEHQHARPWGQLYLAWALFLLWEVSYEANMRNYLRLILYSGGISTLDAPISSSPSFGGRCSAQYSCFPLGGLTYTAQQTDPKTSTLPTPWVSWSGKPKMSDWKRALVEPLDTLAFGLNSAFCSCIKYPLSSGKVKCMICNM